MSAYSIVQTDARCAIGTYDRHGRRVEEEVIAGLAQILSGRDGFMDFPNAYLMDRLRKRPGSDGAVANEATAIRAFLDYLDELGRDFEAVSDDTLKAWRNRIRLGVRPTRRGGRGTHAHARKAGTRSHGHVNAYISAVWRMYVWLEREGAIEGVVDLDPMSREGQGRITVHYERRRRGKGGTRFVEVCPLLLGAEGAKRRDTPNEIDIEDLHARISGKQAERNTFILLMAEHVGARRGDVLQVLATMIPTRSEIEDYIAEQLLYGMDVTGKRKVTRTLNMPAFLALMARDLADGPRADVVRRRKARDPGYVPPPQLILSDRGDAISPNWVSNIVSDLFRQAGQSNRSLHRLRATFLTRVAEAFVRFRDRDGKPLPISTIQLFIQEIAGWTSLSALPAYIGSAYRRSEQTDGEPATVETVRTLMEKLLGR